MSMSIFGDDVMSTVNIFQVCFILDANKWKLNYKEFREEFLNIDKNNIYVKKVLNDLKDLFKIETVEEIKEVLTHDEAFREVCEQTVYCENSEANRKYQNIHLGKCLIDLSRAENPGFII